MDKLLKEIESYVERAEMKKALSASERALEACIKNPELDPTGKYRALSAEVAGFLNNQKITNILKNLTVAFPTVIELHPTAVTFKGAKPKPIDFDKDNAESVAKKCIGDIQFAMQKILAEKNTNEKLFFAIAACYNTLIAIYASIRGFAESDFNEKIAIAREELKQKAAALEGEGAFAELDKEMVRERLAQIRKADAIACSFEEKLQSEALGELEYTHKIPAFTHSVNLSDGAKNFLRDELYVEGSVNAVEALTINRGESSLFIDADISAEAGYLYDNLLKIYLNATLHFEPKMLTFAFIETKDTAQILHPIADELNAVYTGLLYASKTNGIPDDVPASEKRGIIALIDSLYDMRSKRESEFRKIRQPDGSSCKSIEAYNKINAKNPMEYVLLTVNGYPDALGDRSAYNKLLRLMQDGGEAGIFVIVIGKNVTKKIGLQDSIEAIDTDSTGTKLIKISNGAASFLDISASLDAIGSDILFSSYMEKLKERFGAGAKFMLSSIAEATHEKPFYDEISIPLGDAGGRLYSVTTSTEKPPYPFMLVTGSTGRGKSAFLHEFIMSAAYKYAPDELQFYIIDFKASENAPEFLPYKYEKGKDNLYIPHVKFLSLSSKSENALDVVNFITNMINERNRLGYFAEYNRREEVKCGNAPKMPRVYFLIDEYGKMLKGGDSKDDDAFEASIVKHKITDGITSILKIARTYGVGIIFSGQNNELSPDALAQINHRIAFYDNVKDSFEKSFAENWSQKMFAEFTEAKQVGYAFCSSSASLKPEFVRMAYAGNTDKNKDKSEAIYKLATKIREKYKDYTDHSQILVGDTGSAIITDEHPYKSWQEEIEFRIASAKLSYQNEADFLSSGLEDAFRKEAPLSIGISQTGSLPVMLDYKTAGGALGYLAIANAAVLKRIEQNTALAFLYQLAVAGEGKSRILYLEGKRKGFKDAFGDFLEKHPFLEKYIEVVSGEADSARRLIELYESGESKKRLVIMHNLDWLDNEQIKRWMKALDEKKPDTKAPAKQEKKSEAKPSGALASLGISAEQLAALQAKYDKLEWKLSVAAEE